MVFVFGALCSILLCALAGPDRAAPARFSPGELYLMMPSEAEQTAHTQTHTNTTAPPLLRPVSTGSEVSSQSELSRAHGRPAESARSFGR
jgi:hypothetical protein